MRRSQRPPWRHVQLRWQPAPDCPGTHSAGVAAGRGSHFPGRDPGDPRPTHASCAQSLGPHVLGKGRCRPRSHCRSKATPQDDAPPNQGAVSSHRGRGLDRAHWAASLAPTDPQRPPSPPPAQCSPFSQARPVQPSGQAQWPETGSQVPPCRQRQECRQPSPCRPSGQAGRPRGQRGAAPASQARGGPEPLGRASAKPSVGPGSETSPGVTCPRPPALGTAHQLPGPSPPLGESCVHPASQGTLQGPARGAHTPPGCGRGLPCRQLGPVQPGPQ